MYLTLEIRFVSFSEIFLIAGPMIACTYIFRLLIKRAAFCVRHFATNVMSTICFGSLVFVYVFVVVYTKIELDTSHTQHTHARARDGDFQNFLRLFADRHILVRVIILLEWSECNDVTVPTHQGRNSVAVKKTTQNRTLSLGPLLFQEIVYFHVIFYT